MTPAERAVLLAAAASPLVWAGDWRRSDTGLPPQRDPELHRAALSLIRQELLEIRPMDPYRPAEQASLSQDGEDVAETLRDALSPERRQMLRALDSAGELVRRERRISEQEAADVEADGDVPAETVVEWMQPIADGPWSHEREPAKVCSGADLDYLGELGLVALLAGGTRAQLTGAGRWCAEEGQGES